MALVRAVTYQPEPLRSAQVWIVPLFEDDVDMEVAGRQHDVYWQPLRISVSQCSLYAEFARRLLDDADHAEWGTIQHFDHRTLQHAHGGGGSNPYVAAVGVSVVGGATGIVGGVLVHYELVKAIGADSGQIAEVSAPQRWLANIGISYGADRLHKRGAPY